MISLKRLLEDNLGPRGSINNEKAAQALMHYKNTPSRYVDKSSAQLALERSIRDTVPLPREIDIAFLLSLHEIFMNGKQL